MTDHIRLNDMVFYGYHGVLPEERTLGQRFIVDVDMSVDLRAAGRSDDLQQTVNYAEVYAVTRDIMVGQPFLLIEAVAQRIADRILGGYASIDRVVVRIRKPEVPIAGSVLGSSEVCIERERRDLVTDETI